MSTQEWKVPSDVACRDDAVFVTDNDEPLTEWGAAMLFKRLKKRTGIEGKRVSAHNCRRYMATTQLEMGYSPLDVQRQMGHTTFMRNDSKSSADESYGTGYWNE